MGKQGPCYHCGVTSTPLWRNGPPEKPVLCNACGSRWRTKGSLANYTPLHARADLVDSEDYKTFKAKNIPMKTETKSNKKKNSEVNMETNGEASHCDQNFKQVLEEEASNRSSSDSAISYSESCAHLGSADGSDLTGSAQSVVWDSLVPSRKRTCVSRSKPSSVEKLTKDLCSILHEQQQSSHFSASSEEDLLLESGSPLDSFEIGHGGCLVKFINSNCREEESEASSLSVYSKSQIVTKAYVGPQTNLTPRCKEINIPNVGDGKIKKLNSDGVQESTRRDKLSEEKLAVLSRTSPLASVDLRVIVNFEEFTRHMNLEEQQLLMKYLPSTDTANLPDSLISMFDSPQFLETLSSFQQLLREGIFDMPCTGIANTKYRILRRLVLSTLAKSKWIEHYQQHKDIKQKKTTVYNEQMVGPSLIGYGNSIPLQRPKDDQNQNIIEPHSYSTCKKLKFTSAGREGSYVNVRNLLSLSEDRKSSILGSFQLSNESSDQDLLFDVPSNASFPEAELLNYHSSKSKILLTSREIEAANPDDIPSNESSSTLSSQIPSVGMTLLPYPVCQ